MAILFLFSRFRVYSVTILYYIVVFVCFILKRTKAKWCSIKCNNLYIKFNGNSLGEIEIDSNLDSDETGRIIFGRDDPHSVTNVAEFTLNYAYVTAVNVYASIARGLSAWTESGHAAHKLIYKILKYIYYLPFVQIDRITRKNYIIVLKWPLSCN